MQRLPPASARQRRVVVPIGHVGERLDVFLSNQIRTVSRSSVAQLVRMGLVQVNGLPAKASVKEALGDQITVQLPPEPGPPEPEMLALDIVYEDSDIVVVNKPPGMVVHPAPGHSGSTLVNAMLARHPELSCGEEGRPGIVHRLDKETSGLLVVALHEDVRKSLVEQFKTRAVHKEYIALVAGQPPAAGVLDSPIGRHPTRRKRMSVVPGGRPACTEYVVIESLGNMSLILARPLTGRTHQIRVHMDSIGHPIVGDAIYGGRAHRRLLSGVLNRQFLHAHKIEFKLENWSQFRVFEAPLPEDLQVALDFARHRSGG